MSKRRSRIFFYLFLLGIFLLKGFTAEAQLRQIPLEKLPAKPQKKSYSQRIMAAGDTLSLPFWDDFSFTGTEPHDSLWLNSTNVAVTDGLAIRPPGLKVATFDGLDSLGRPYRQDPTLSGTGDSLSSRFINLGLNEVSAEEQASVFLSFYWQLQGRGERPDSGDSLKLFFLDDTDTVWHQVWQKGGSAAIDSAAFKQELISLKEAGEALKKAEDDPDVNFFHKGFRFRFSSSNRLSGMFDLWHVDYVYLNKNRSSTDFYYSDRAIADAKPSLFQPYTAIPINQYFASPETYNSPFFEFTAFNHEPPADKDQVSYNLSLFDAAGTLISVLVDSATVGNAQNSFLFGQSFLEEVAPGLSAETLLPYAGEDSLYLQAVTSLYFADEKPFYSANDTIVVQNVLHDYFAYDDGTAEYALEVSGGRGLRVAYEFELQEADTITHLEMYVPFYLQGSGGQFIDLKVWQNLAFSEVEKDSLLVSFRDVPVSNSQGFNKFNTYALPQPVVVPAGKFYIGLEKLSDQFLAIGFDRNTNNKEKLFVSTNQETWFAGQEDDGSLMLRPRFARVADPSVVGIRERELSIPLNLYPNPSNGRFTIEAEQEALAVQVYSSQGILMRTAELPAGGNRKEVELNLPNGFYLVKVQFRTGTTVKKIFIKN